MASEAEPTPGWYHDTDDPDTLRYWDGTKWTDETAPRHPPPEAGPLWQPNPVAVEARKSINILFTISLLLVIAGVILAGASYPRNEVSGVSLSGVEMTESGDQGTYGLGLLIAGAGSVMMLIPLIAWGVSLGLKVSRD